MNVQRCRTTGLVVLFVIAILMFARVVLALDGQVRGDAPIAVRHALRVDPSHAVSGQSAPVHGPAETGWLSQRAPWAKIILDPVLLPLVALRDEARIAYGIASAHASPDPNEAASQAPSSDWVDRLLAIPLRPIQIGESRLRPLDPKPGAGVVIKLPF